MISVSLRAPSAGAPAASADGLNAAASSIRLAPRLGPKARQLTRRGVMNGDLAIVGRFLPRVSHRLFSAALFNLDGQSPRRYATGCSCRLSTDGDAGVFRRPRRRPREATPMP